MKTDDYYYLLSLIRELQHEVNQLKEKLSIERDCKTD